ncbi:MAG TPA: bacterial transcriptional activator domain-containing protein, partial [Longimicrobiales bacterium]|nr:bacterial transcriptional activator domain-containing protein [Longimicrobiales bacterium]
SQLFQARALDLLALARSSADPEQAAYCFGSADAMRRHMDAVRFRMDEERVQAATAAIRASIGDAAFDTAYARGSAVAVPDAIDEVLAGSGPAPAPPPAVREEPAVAPSGATADLRVLVLGPFEVWVQGERVPAWQYARPKELLVHLLGAPRGRTRDEIGSAIWPEATPAQLRNSFHVTMHHLRKALGHADWVVLEEQRYRVAPGISVLFDATEFERSVRHALTLTGDARLAALRSALAWYRGHFLEGESMGVWRDEEQDRLRALYADGALNLGALLEERGETQQAMALYEALVAAEPLLEEAHRRMIAAWSAGGERARALRHYDRLLATLSQLDLDPEPETEELLARISARA